MQRKKLLYLSFLLIGIMVIQSCRRPDYIARSSSDPIARFFSGKPSDPTVLGIYNSIRHEQERKPFINEFVTYGGYPVWQKSVTTKGKAVLSKGHNVAEDVEWAIIPFVDEENSRVGAFMNVRIIGNDTVFKMHYHHEYKDYPVALQSGGKWNAENLFNYFAYFEKSVLNRDALKLTDSTIRIYLNDSIYTSNQPTIHTTGIEVQGKVIIRSSTNCWTYAECPTPTASVCNDADGCDAYNASGCGTGQCKLIKDCFTHTDIIDIDDPMGIDGGTGPSGGSGGGGSWSDNPCRPSIYDSSNPCSGIFGWTQELDLPYQCNYTLTAEDNQIWSQIEQEDFEADQQSPMDCRGTNRFGSIQFQGNLEHWIIQLDYLKSNPTNGEVEYQIPNAGSNGGKGYADIVNLSTGEIWEVKPADQTKLQTYLAEVANYIQKANQYCARPPGLSWNYGSSYPSSSSRYFPTTSPNRYLTSRQFGPGLILYQYVTMSTNPLPVTDSPTSDVKDKLRELVRRLRDNSSLVKNIISEYLRNNPGLVTYLKTAAFAAAVTIVVGTIIEDFATMGAGLSNDWSSFLLARSIIRFAQAL